MASTIDKLTGMDLDALELKENNPDWTDTTIIEFLSLIRNIKSVAEDVDTVDGTKIEEIETDFTDGSIPFAKSNLLVEDNANLYWSSALSALVSIGLFVSDTTPSRILSTDGSRKVVSVSNLTSWIAGTLNQIVVTDDGDGTVTLVMSNNFLPIGITGSDLRPVDDDGDGTVSFSDDELEFYIQAVA